MATVKIPGGPKVPGFLKPNSVTPEGLRKSGVRPAWMEKPHPLAVIGKFLVIAIICFVTIYPFVLVIGTSLSTTEEINRKGGLVLWPDSPSLDAYYAIFSGGTVSGALIRSILITVIGTAVHVVATILMAYGLSKRDLVGGKFFLMTVLLTMLFSPGLIPSFLMVNALGLMNNYAALILPGLISAFNMVILRSFFMNIPEELKESARIDGAGDLSILWRIILPLSKGVIAVITLFTAVGFWNSYFGALLYLESDKWPLPMILREYVLLGAPMADGNFNSEVVVPSQAIQMAVVVVSLVPILLVYPFLQKYFTKGVLTGAIKG